MNGCHLPFVRVVIEWLAVQLCLTKRSLSLISTMSISMTIGLALLQLLQLLSSKFCVERIQSCSLVCLELELSLVLD